MIESIAFQTGICFSLAICIASFSRWILGSLSGIKTEEVRVFANPFFSFYKKRVKSIEIIFGWVPIICDVKFSGMMDSNLQDFARDPKNYELRGKSFFTRFFIMISGPLLVTLFGAILLLTISTNVIYFKEFVTFLRISFFIIPLDMGNNMWEEFYSNPYFLIGFIFFYCGSLNLVLSFLGILNEIIKAKYTLYANLLFIVVAIFFTLPFYRLIWLNFSITNVLNFFLGAYLVGVCSLLISFILTFVLPNQHIHYFENIPTLKDDNL